MGTGDAEQQVDSGGDVSDPDVEPSEGGTGSWPRAVLTGVVGVLAVIALVAGVLGFWTIRVARDSDRFEAKTEELLQTEEISDALARRIVNEVASALELSEALDAVVPDILEPTVAVLLAGVRSRVELQLGEQLRQERFVELVGAAVGTAHAAAIDVIEGDDVVDGVAVVDGEVRVNLLPVVALALTDFQEIGLFSDAEIPQLERAGDPDEQRQELADALGRELPDDFGEIVVVRGDSLERAGDTVQRVRDVLVLAKRTFWLLLAVGLGLGALAIWLSARRWRSASFLVAGLFALTLVVRLVVGRAREKLPNVVEQPGARATVDELARGLEASLNSTLLWVSISALVVLILTAVVTSRYPRPAD